MSTVLNSILIMLATVLIIFWEAAFNGFRHFFGAQIDLLPALMVYAGLTAGLPTVAASALFGGLWFDSLSANPLGVSVMPLFLLGVLIFATRELIVRDQLFAQFILGLAASAAVPVMVLLTLLTSGREPLIGWGTLWQIVIMSLGGAIATPVFFELFALLHRAFGYRKTNETSFRPDREIARGRDYHIPKS